MNIDSLKTNMSKLMQCTHCTAVYGAVVNQERFEVVPYLRKMYLLVRFFELTLYCSWATALLWSL